uniref:Membrane insertase YidC/Oxa/ALB C-terminal domain-containing protein n=1 Tax=Proboscia inermis TaxID=420281 RepID=A0A7S0CAS3_9STRA|mmetsp:Transcript_36703/g.36973  ORF Transcript_36703/g.36973 Transcript_36703/m.36973 type:complete len:420 (+) Transcript_36703:104-1363(+)
MKFSLSVIVLALSQGTSSAFVTPSSTTKTAPAVFGNARRTSLRMTFDPSNLNDLQDSFSSMLVAADAAINALPLDTTVPAAAVADPGNGWFGFLAGPIEETICVIHNALNGIGLSSNSWGASIIILIFLIKGLTFPLTKAQLESTSKMQVLQPKIKEIQAKYASNPEVMNQKVSSFYKDNEVNPLAGCLPSLAQLPIFIGLYRAVLNLAKQNTLDESFLWLPSLEGPTYGADPAHGLDWVTQGWINGVPSLGWEDTLKFGTLPVLLVITQLISQQIMQPPKPESTGADDTAADTTNQILKFLPFMLGYFSLGVPSALGIYWVINNVATTALNVVIKNNIVMPDLAVESDTSTTVVDTEKFGLFTEINPTREKASGFATPDADPNVVTPITSVDAEVIDSNTASTRPKQQRGKKKKKKRN